jgi:hypothetical protein
LRYAAPTQAIRALEDALALYQDICPAVDTWGRERHAELQRTYNSALLMLGQIHHEHQERARRINEELRDWKHVLSVVEGWEIAYSNHQSLISA